VCCFVVVCVLEILGGGWRLGDWGEGGVSRRGLIGDCVVGISALLCSAWDGMGWDGMERIYSPNTPMVLKLWYRLCFGKGRS
jgi:hypothetical protein